MPRKDGTGPRGQGPGSGRGMGRGGAAEARETVEKVWEEGLQRVRADIAFAPTVVKRQPMH
jgi:hypothetical protein